MTIFFTVWILLVTTTATTVFGQASSADDIRIFILPSPTLNGKVVNALGETGVLTCKGDVPNPDLMEDMKWYYPDQKEIKDSEDPRITLVPTDEGLSVHISSFRDSDAGFYRCTATYAKTTKLEANVSLASYVPITFDSAPKDQYATKGEDYKIECVVKSDPEPRVTWYKDHKRVSNSDRYVVHPDGLLVRNVSESDEGVYKCGVTVIVMGHSKEQFISLQVQEKPRVISLVTEMEGVEGESVSMKCIGEGKPKPQVEWLHQGQSLYGIPRHTVDKYEGSLLIENLLVEDKGNYVCRLNNSAGTAEGTVLLSVISKPVIQQFLNTTVPVDNTSAILICRASGNPPPDILFHKESQPYPFTLGVQERDNRIFQEQKRIDGEITEGSLKIKHVMKSDDGLYNCIASNGRSRTERMGHITVEFVPTFEHTPMKEAWMWGSKAVNLTCFAESIPNATFTWFLEVGGNSLPIKLGENEPYRVYGLESLSSLLVSPGRERLGLYTCVATNKLGVASHSILLREATTPGRIQQVITGPITATTVSFKIAGPVTDGGLPVNYYIVHYKSERDTWDSENYVRKTWPIEEDIITIEGLEPLRSYSFRFAAINEAGNGEFSEKIETTMKRAAPEVPSIITESSGGYAFTPYSDQIEIKWSHPLDNGEKIDKFEISYIPVRNSTRWEIDGEKTDIHVLPPHLSYLLSNLQPNTYYRVDVRAHNSIGWGNPSHIIIKTAGLHGYSGGGLVKAAPTDAKLDIPLIVTAAIVILLVVLLLIDFVCCRVSRRGMFYAISMRFCNKKTQSARTTNSKGATNGEKQPIPDLEALDRFHNPSDLEDLPSNHAVSQPLITDTKSNGNGTSPTPANTFV